MTYFTWFPQRDLIDQPIAILKNFIHHTGVPVTFTSVEYTIKNYPNYPSISLKDFGKILQTWGVETLFTVVKISDLYRLPYPAIAHLSENGGSFIVLYQLIKDEIIYIHPQLGWQQDSISVFAPKWQGDVLLALPTKGCGELDYDKKRAEELNRQQLNPFTAKIKNYPSFLSSEECNHLIEIATPLFTPSQVLSDNSPISHQGRSSNTALLEKNDDPILLTIYQRASNLLQLPIEHLEYGQCVSYTKGQEYKAHFDTVDENTLLGQKIIRKFGQRIVTMLIYLNDDFKGGETFFPTVDYKIAPQQGTAVVFYNLIEHNKVDPDSLHAGLPVFSGQKYAFNLWAWNRPFRLLHS